MARVGPTTRASIPSGNALNSQCSEFTFNSKKYVHPEGGYPEGGCHTCFISISSDQPRSRLVSGHHVLRVPAVSSEVRDFAIVPLHAAPTDAVTEIDALYDVYLDVRQKWGLEVRPP